MTREAHRFSSNVRQPYEDSRTRKRWPQLEAEARALLDWLAARGYATWTREPGGPSAFGLAVGPGVAARS